MLPKRFSFHNIQYGRIEQNTQNISLLEALQVGCMVAHSYLRSLNPADYLVIARPPHPDTKHIAHIDIQVS